MQFLSKLGSLQAGSSQNWPARLNAVAPTLLAVVLVVAIAAQLALLVLKFLAPPAEAPGVVAAQGATAGPNLAGIVNAHLFGTALQAGVDAASAPDDQPAAGPGRHAGGHRSGAGLGHHRRYAADGAGLRDRHHAPGWCATQGSLRRPSDPRARRQTRIAAAAATGGWRAACPLPTPRLAPEQSLADSVRSLVQKDPGAHLRAHPATAGLCGRPAEGLPDLSRSQPWRNSQASG